MGKMGRLGKKVDLLKPINVDSIPIRKDSFFTNAFKVELPLDSQPGYVWQTLFEQEWRTSLQLWERKVVVVGDKLHLVTASNEICEKIDWLKKIIDSTNIRLDKLERDRKIIEEAEENEELRKHENVIKDTLRMKLSVV